jgi:hypothetical protein
VQILYAHPRARVDKIKGFCWLVFKTSVIAKSEKIKVVSWRLSVGGECMDAGKRDVQTVAHGRTLKVKTH